MDIKEELAELEHTQWAHWTKYMLDNLTPENIARWKQQIITPYRKLSEKEKDSDREWAERVLEIINADGCYLVGDRAGVLVKQYFKISEEAKQELRDIEKKIRGDMTDEEWAFFKTIRC